MRMTISGIQQAQEANLRMMAAVKPTGALDRASREAAVQAQRIATVVTHRDTGALAASHRIRAMGPARHEVFIDSSAVNPRGGRPSVYGPWEHARGGSHAFYQVVVDEYGKDLQRAAMVELLRGLG